MTANSESTLGTLKLEIEELRTPEPCFTHPTAESIAYAS